MTDLETDLHPMEISLFGNSSEVINLENYDVHKGSISDDHWTTLNNYAYIIIPVEFGDKYSILANQNYSTRCYFLEEYDTQKAPSIVNRITIPTRIDMDCVVPATARFLYVETLANNNVTKPDSVIKLENQGLVDKVSEINNVIIGNDRETELIKTVSEYTSSYITIANDLVEGKKYILHVDNSTGNWSRFGFTSNETISKWSTDVEMSIIATNTIGTYDIEFIAPAPTSYPYIGITRANRTIVMNVYEITKEEKKKGVEERFNDIEEEIDNLEEEISESKTSLKILHIGNSYTLDACSYIHKLCDNIGVDLVVGIVYNAGASLQQYQETLIPNDTCATYYKYSNGLWQNNSNYDISDAINDENWDIVVLQQKSADSPDWSTYEPYLSYNIQTIAKMFGNNLEFCFLLTTPHIGNDMGITDFTGQATAAQNTLNFTGITSVIPVGTALQNLRSIERFNNIPTAGAGMMVDSHPQTGIAMLVESYTYIAWVLNKLGQPIKIIGSTYRPISGDALTTHGTGVIGINDKNCKIAQLAAISAIKKPYQITDMNDMDDKIIDTND